MDCLELLDRMRGHGNMQEVKREAGGKKIMAPSCVPDFRRLLLFSRVKLLTCLHLN